MTETLRVTYELRAEHDEDPRTKARDIAYEQTVELSPALVPGEVDERIPGRIEQLEPLPGDRLWQAVIAFPAAAIGTELTQALNVLFGNISLKRGIRIVDVEWPTSLLDAVGGPRLGIEGLRAMAGSPARPLVATAVKPMGLGAAELADICARFARGGIDIIKDDHGLANQPSAPYYERVARSQEAVTGAAAASGTRSVYFPNVSAPWPHMMERSEYARAQGCPGVLVNPMITGLDAIHSIADETGLAVLAHPSLTGSYFLPDHGIVPEVLLGDIFRMAGADAVIYPNVGGRFGFSGALCGRINDHLRRPFAGLRAAMPAPGGGMAVDQAGHWAARYGRDTILLIGGSLYAQGDLETGSRRLRAAVETFDERE